MPVTGARRRMASRRLIGALLVAVASTVPGADLPEAWRHWQFYRTVGIPAEGNAALYRVRIPAAVFDGSLPGLADLRLVDEGGREVPYALLARWGGDTVSWRPAALSDVGFVRGAFTEAFLDLGTDPGPHNLLAIETDRPDFFVRAEVAVSDDRHAWRVMREAAPLFRFEEGQPPENLHASYPETRARWLRLRLPLEQEPFELRGCRVAHRVAEEPELEPLDGRTITVAGDPGESVWEVDLRWSGIPVRGVRFDGSAGEFHRSVRILVRDEREEAWREAGEAEIFRRRAAEDTGAGGELVERLQILFPESAGRRWRIVVRDRSDPPLPGLRPDLLGTPRYAVFTAQPGRQYRLLHGNPRAEPAAYDLARITPADELAEASLATLGREERNAGWVSPEPWTERHPLVLWVTLVAAIAVLGLLAWRSLR